MDLNARIAFSAALAVLLVILGPTGLHVLSHSLRLGRHIAALAAASLALSNLATKLLLGGGALLASSATLLSLKARLA